MADSPEHHRERSNFIKGLVQRSEITPVIDERYKHGAPKKIIQYWHDTTDLPDDVAKCISSWKRWTESGFEHHLFDEFAARRFISRKLGARYERAFDCCYHPSMQADYFRLCYLLVEGGFYFDADDECVGSEIGWLAKDRRLKIQPLCYDMEACAMVQASRFLEPGADRPGWIFYFNNNPLIAGQENPIIERALQRATSLLEAVGESVLPEIQETTGPGNLTKSIFELGFESAGGELDLVVLRDWDSFALSKWPLSYRNDTRNWRHSNQKRFRPESSGSI